MSISASPDLIYDFYTGNAQIVVEEIKSYEIVIVTNQHLALTDPLWMAILIFANYVLIGELLKRFGKYVAYSCAFCYLFYCSPLFGFSPTPIPRLDPALKGCQIQDKPPFGLELSFRGILDATHFTLNNDWVRLSCPPHIFSIESLQNTRQRTLNTTTPAQLHFVHLAEEKWWNRRELGTNHIYLNDRDLLKAHKKFFEDKRDECVNKMCIWQGNVIKETRFYYVMNLSMLPGHSGSSCRENHGNDQFHGIVQSFHEGHGYNICSKLSDEAQFPLFWFILVFWPLILIFMAKMIVKINLKNVHSGMLTQVSLAMFIVSVTFLWSFSEYVYF